jgi:CheY-like chemotaxis protein
MKGVVLPKEQHLQHVKQNKARRHLVVDDAEINRRLIQLYLEAKHLTVDAAASGAAALEKVEAAGIDGYDVVWTDLSMEGMSGIELTTQLCGLGFQGYVVVLTGNISESAMRPVMLRASTNFPEADAQKDVARYADHETVRARVARYKKDGPRR